MAAIRALAYTKGQPGCAGCTCTYNTQQAVLNEPKCSVHQSALIFRRLQRALFLSPQIISDTAGHSTCIHSIGCWGWMDSSNAHTCCMIANGTCCRHGEIASCWLWTSIVAWCVVPYIAWYVLVHRFAAGNAFHHAFSGACGGLHEALVHRCVGGPTLSTTTGATQSLHPIFRRLRRASLSHCPQSHMAVPGDIHQGLEMDPTPSPHLGYVSPALPPRRSHGRSCPQSGHWALGVNG